MSEELSNKSFVVPVAPSESARIVEGRSCPGDSSPTYYLVESANGCEGFCISEIFEQGKRPLPQVPGRVNISRFALLHILTAIDEIEAEVDGQTREYMRFEAMLDEEP